MHFGLLGSGGTCSALTIRVDTLDLFLTGTDLSDATCVPDTVFLATCVFDQSLSPTGKLDVSFSGPNCVIPDISNLFTCSLTGSLGDVQSESRLTQHDCGAGAPTLCVDDSPCVTGVVF